MSPKNVTIVAGLVTVLGWVGVSRLLAQGPANIPKGMTAKAQANPDANGPPTVLLLLNGKVLQGEVQKTEAGYALRQKFGVMLFDRSKVERMFRSMAEVYAYKKSLCAENDPDDQLKLATWCIEQKLNSEAKAHLQSALALSPESRRAKAMLANLDRTPAPGPTRDDEVQRTGAEMVETAAPAELSLNKLREEVARNPRAAGMPAIFDLETPLAVRRYQEFATFVHPILQQRCARCHNELSPSVFQMIETKAARDMSNELIARSNLESTLRIIDRDDLAHSPLLSAAGMTHNAGGKPVLGGPNNAQFRTLSTWVNSLRVRADPPSRPGVGSTSIPPSEGFAAGRLESPSTRATLPPDRTPEESQSRPASARAPFPGMVTSSAVSHEIDGQAANLKVLPPGSLVPGSANGLPANPPPDSSFLTDSPVAPPKAGRSSSPKPPSSQDRLNPKGDEPMVPLPNGELVPVITKEMTLKESSKASGKKKISNKILEQMLKKGHKGEAVEVKVPSPGS